MEGWDFEDKDLRARLEVQLLLHLARLPTPIIRGDRAQRRRAHGP